jgi:hypothetical protein
MAPASLGLRGLYSLASPNETVEEHCLQSDSTTTTSAIGRHLTSDSPAQMDSRPVTNWPSFERGLRRFTSE